MNEDELFGKLSASLQPQRGADESFQVYQKRRKAGNDLNKLTKKGMLFWDSRTLGTYKSPNNDFVVEY